MVLKLFGIDIDIDGIDNPIKGHSNSNLKLVLQESHELKQCLLFSDFSKGLDGL